MVLNVSDSLVTFGHGFLPRKFVCFDTNKNAKVLCSGLSSLIYQRLQLPQAQRTRRHDDRLQAIVESEKPSGMPVLPEFHKADTTDGVEQTGPREAKSE